MKFQKYFSIENSYRQEFVDKIIIEGKDQGVWVVTEKIHGANFSFWYNGKQTRMAKRTALMADSDDFYGIQKLRDDIIEMIKHIYEMLKEESREKIEQLVVYGEICGGNYPHPEVAVDNDSKKVQKGVYYCPSNAFIVYDIMMDDEFLNFDDMQALCDRVKLPYVYAIHVGTFKECLNYTNLFPSTISKRFGLPSIEGNICEGIVIRPNKTQYLSNGSRVMLKSKNEKFKEKEHKPKKKVEIELTDIEEEILEEMHSFVTENRYDSVVSKIGEVKVADFGRLQGEFNKDVIAELMKNNRLAMEYNNLKKAERNRLNKIIGRETAEIIRKKLIRGK